MFSAHLIRRSFAGVLLASACFAAGAAVATPLGNSRMLSDAAPTGIETVQWRARADWRSTRLFAGRVAPGAYLGGAFGYNGYSYRGPAYDNYPETYANNYAYRVYPQNHADNYVNNYRDNYVDSHASGYVGDDPTISACAQRKRTRSPCP